MFCFFHCDITSFMMNDDTRFSKGSYLPVFVNIFFNKDGLYVFHCFKSAVSKRYVIKADWFVAFMFIAITSWVLTHRTGVTSCSKYRYTVDLVLASKCVAHISSLHWVTRRLLAFKPGKNPLLKRRGNYVVGVNDFAINCCADVRGIVLKHIPNSFAINSSSCCSCL